MNLKKFTTLLFVLLFATATVVFAANNTRNVYSVYSDNFNGAHIYDAGDSIPTSDTDGIKFYPWSTSDWEPANPHIIMGATTIDGTASDPAPEGKQYIRYLWGSVEQSYSTTYVGCSYTRISGDSSESSINMSAYAGGQIKFYARSNKEYAKKCKIGFKLANGTQSWFATTLTNINENWQEFSFDLPSSIGDVSVIFMMMIDGEPAHTVGEAFLDIDNIRWVQSGGTAGISFVTKNVSDDQETTGSASFTEDTFGQGWSVASQYIELDIDGEFSNNNWNVRVYSNNISTTTAGLYNETVNDILPMAWKISWTTLPFSYTDAYGENANTLEIGENWQKNDQGKDYMAGLYDAGKVAIKGDDAKWWYPWFFVQKNADTTAHSLLINNKGCHTFESTGTSGVTEEYFDTPESAYAGTYDRKPKLFLACNTKEAKAVKYTGSLVVNLSYE